MSRIELKRMPLRRASRFPGLRQKSRWILFALFLVAWLLDWIGLWVPGPILPKVSTDGVVVLSAALTTVAALARRLPAQNVLLASTIIITVEVALQFLDAATGLPFGPRQLAEGAAKHLFWALPLAWFTILINSRGVARLILRPWRLTPRYGLWVIGLAVLLGIVALFGLEPFGTVVRKYWTWPPSRIPGDWYGVPWVSFFGWGVSALILMAFVTPALINKNPAKQPPDLHPLCVWLLLQALWATGAIVHRLWTAAVLAAVLALAVSALVITSATRQSRASGRGV